MLSVICKWCYILHTPFHSTMESVEAMVVRNKFQEMTQHIKKWAPRRISIVQFYWVFLMETY